MIDFIQIGANIGNTDTDPLWNVVRDRGWKGIFIEPIKSSFDQLVNNYQDISGCLFENVAVMAYDGEITIYTMSNGYCDRQQASVVASHFSGRNDLAITVPCVTLNNLVEKYNLGGIPFELLQIDAENVDDKIITSTNFNIVLPHKVRFEHIHMGETRKYYTIEYLKSFGYKVIPDEYNYLHPQGEKGFDTMMERITNE